MMRFEVCIHARKGAGHLWEDEARVFLRVPVVGEYLTLCSEGEWFRIDAVLHTPWNDQYVAEVFATQVSHPETFTLTRRPD